VRSCSPISQNLQCWCPPATGGSRLSGPASARVALFCRDLPVLSPWYERCFRTRTGEPRRGEPTRHNATRRCRSASGTVGCGFCSRGSVSIPPSEIKIRRFRVSLRLGLLASLGLVRLLPSPFLSSICVR